MKRMTSILTNDFFHAMCNVFFTKAYKLKIKFIKNNHFNRYSKFLGLTSIMAFYERLNATERRSNALLGQLFERIIIDNRDRWLARES